MVRMGTNPGERVKEVKGKDLVGRTTVSRCLMGHNQACLVGLVRKGSMEEGEEGPVSSHYVEELSSLIEE